jgi:hypothetical protein
MYTDEVIDIIHQTVNDLCQVKGYHITISRANVDLVLQAEEIVKEAAKRIVEKNAVGGGGRSKGASQAMKVIKQATAHAVTRGGS